MKLCGKNEGKKKNLSNFIAPGLRLVASRRSPESHWPIINHVGCHVSQGVEKSVGHYRSGQGVKPYNTFLHATNMWANWGHQDCILGGW